MSAHRNLKAAILLLGTAICACGCASKQPQEPAARAISLADFAGPPVIEVVDVGVDGADASAETVVSGAASGTGAGTRILGAGGPEAADPFEAATPVPPDPNWRGRSGGRSRGVLEPGERVIVDSMVGQINGRPVFADDFFAPIADRLIAESSKARSLEQFMLEAHDIVSAELLQVVLNALYLAEAEGSLTVEQQKGLRAFLAQLEDEVIAGHGGSEAKVPRNIRENEDLEFEAHIENLKDELLIQQLFRTRILPRVIVSWRDIEREYRRREAEFNPPPTFELARIRLRTEREADKIVEVTRQLAAGEPFMEVATELGSARGGVWQTFEVPGGDLSTVELANDVIRDALGTLQEVGDTCGPLEIGSTTWWIHVASIDRPRSYSLYDPEVQLLLSGQIRSERGSEEQNRYVDSLLEKGIYDELQGMSNRLLQIAVLRYGP